MENPIVVQILAQYLKRNWEMPTDWAAARFSMLLVEHWEEIKTIVEHTPNVVFQKDRLEI